MARKFVYAVIILLLAGIAVYAGPVISNWILPWSINGKWEYEIQPLAVAPKGLTIRETGTVTLATQKAADAEKFISYSRYYTGAASIKLYSSPYKGRYDDVPLSIGNCRTGELVKVDFDFSLLFDAFATPLMVHAILEMQQTARRDAEGTLTLVCGGNISSFKVTAHKKLSMGE